MPLRILWRWLQQKENLMLNRWMIICILFILHSNLYANTAKTKTFDAVLFDKNITLPLLDGYQHITPHSDAKFFELFDILERVPKHSNIAFLINNKDYMKILLGTTENQLSSYFSFRQMDALKNRKVSLQTLKRLSTVMEISYQRLLKSNLMKDELEKHHRKHNKEMSKALDSNITMNTKTIKPLNFIKRDKSFSISMQIHSTVQDNNKTLEIQTLSISTVVYYQNSILSIASFTPLDTNVSIKDIQKEKEQQIDNYLKLFK